ncbi:MAG TPA: pitrilysin family protein [Steroidobacteraceae bacterium]|jgi:zinc protease|nr:pitrilysin family protein [Steroidobacteraceae bacterium]
MIENGKSSARAAFWIGVAAAFGSAAIPAAAIKSAAPVQAAHAAPSSGFTRIRSLGGIDEYRLDSNGLTVLLVPDHSAPVVTFQVTYQVGSRNEVTGTTGATHILEHLMFKGSDAFNDAKGNSIKQMLERVGGQFNANTSFDRTNYFATLGRENLESYIAIEADRMRHLWLHESDRQAEMTVVRNEYERGKNDPEDVLFEEVMEAAYVSLPYHHPVIGWKSDIEHVPIAKLREFYDTFYWPNNATVTVVGDIEAETVLGLIKKYYGVYPHSPAPIPAIYTEESPQSGERRVTVTRPGELGSIIVAHKVPNGRDPDQAPLEMLNAILSSGKNGRLYRALVDQGLALSAGAGTELLHDLSLHTLFAALGPGTTHEQVEKALLAELTKIKTSGVTPAEVATVKQQYIAEDAYKRDGTAGVASELSEWIGIGDWTLYVTFPQKVQQVTPADVQRVAKQYFAADQSTIGWFVPVAPKTEKGS